MIILGKGTSYEIQGAYRIGMALRAEPAILGKGRRYLGGLEQHLPYVLVRRVEELRNVWCLAGSNSHKLNARLRHGSIRRKSMTWTTLTSLIFLLIMFLTQFWSPVSSTDEPQDRPFSFQEVSRMGMPD